MKRFLILFALSLLAANVSAQSLVGKWKGQVYNAEEVIPKYTDSGANMNMDTTVTYSDDGTAISESYLMMSMPLDEETVVKCRVKVELGFLWSYGDGQLTEITNGIARYTVEDIEFEPSSPELELLIPSFKQHIQAQIDDAYDTGSEGVERVCSIEFISDDEHIYSAGAVEIEAEEAFEAPKIKFTRVVE